MENGKKCMKYRKQIGNKGNNVDYKKKINIIEINKKIKYKEKKNELHIKYIQI